MFMEYGFDDFDGNDDFVILDSRNDLLKLHSGSNLFLISKNDS